MKVNKAAKEEAKRRRTDGRQPPMYGKQRKQREDRRTDGSRQPQHVRDHSEGERPEHADRKRLSAGRRRTQPERGEDEAAPGRP